MAVLRYSHLWANFLTAEIVDGDGATNVGVKSKLKIWRIRIKDSFHVRFYFTVRFGSRLSFTTIAQ